MPPMADRYPPLVRVPTRTPTVGAPGPYVERRQRSRRREDRLAHEEAALLARALDELVADATADARLAGLLELLARTVGARRAAVLSGSPERRVAVSVGQDEDEADARSLAAWLDAEAPRSRAERAAAGRAPIMIARRSGRSDSTGATDRPDSPVRPPGDPEAPEDFGDDELESAIEPDSMNGRAAAVRWLPPDARFALIEIPSTGHVVLGFEMSDEEGVLALADRLPPTLARHAAVVLALVTEQLAQAAELEALRAHEAERERFVSTVAHDLRTPLTGLSGYLDLIAEGRVEDPAVEREFVERSRLIVDSMGDLVGDLLEISRLDAGTLRLELRPFSVAEVANRALAALAPLALERGIALHSDLPPRMRAATGDRREVQRILTNLLGNALKFTPEGGHVELAGWFDGSWALLAVRDDGPGVAPGDRSRIFERFYRVDSQATVSGTGLGLAIARDLARTMDGELAVASVQDTGSSFVLVLPGPAQVGDDTIDVILDRALADEEVLLEEAAVLRAIRTAGRPVALEPPARDPDAPPPEPVPAGQPVRLRAIDGALSRFDPPDLA
jgi:signal transduction histidine kinase